MRITVFLVSLFCLVSCGYFHEQDNLEILARVGSYTIDKSDIKPLLSDKTTNKDSVQLVKDYIDSWVKKQLLLQKAEQNMSDKKVEEYEQMIQRYREELYINYYVESISQKSLDTSISEKELRTYYKQNKQRFLLDQDIVKLVYVHAYRNQLDYRKVKEKVKNMKEEYREEIENAKIKYMPYFINDTTWVKLSEIQEKAPSINYKKVRNSIVKDRVIEVKDKKEDGVYIIKFNDYLKSGEIAPYSHVRGIVYEILLNKKKLNFIKELEKGIIRNAIKKKQLEIYD